MAISDLFKLTPAGEAEKKEVTALEAAAEKARREVAGRGLPFRTTRPDMHGLHCNFKRLFKGYES